MTKMLYYVVKSALHYYPPCISQIRILNDLGIDVTVIYGSSDNAVLDILRSEGVNLVQLTDPRGKYPGKLDKINNWLQFRKAAKKYLKGISKEDSVLWFGNAESVIPLSGLLSGRKYIVSFLELLDKHPQKLKAVTPLAKEAAVVTTCEETRSYLMQSWFNLEKLPYTIPNKPYNVPFSRGTIPTTEAGLSILEETKGAKFVIYQGIFQNPEYMNAIAQVMHDYFPDMYLVLMGIDKYNIVENVKKIHKNTISVNYIPSPLHLQVTSNAYIGVLYYKPDELNKVFCAPNKIFEYSYFGLPIIGNDIPGLKNTIGKAKAGVCIDFSYESVFEAFTAISQNYSQMSKNAVDFYNSVDNVDTIRKIATETGLL